MSNPFTISVAIPCFNAEKYIRAALESLLNQSIAAHEIIVIDDGSTDKTCSIIKQFPDIQLVVHKQNRGIAASRNSAWKAASGNIVIFIDADTIAAPDCIAKLIEQYSNDSIAGVGGNGIESVQKNIYDLWRKEILFQNWGNHNRNDVPFLFGLCSSYRRTVLQEVGGFAPIFKVSGEDMDIGFRINKRGYKLAYASEAVVYHRRSDQAESIKKMVYRHCFWGFVAQRKNATYANKVTVWRSLILLLRHLFIDGFIKRSSRYALLSINLHLLIARAWLDARKHHSQASVTSTSDQQVWEGHNTTKSNETV